MKKSDIKPGESVAVFSRTDPNKKHKFIYTVTCITELPDNTSKDLRKYSPDKSCFGWFTSLRKATLAVMENHGDIHEFSYNYAVIEKSKDGFRNLRAEEWWFEWDEDRDGFKSIDKPKEWAHVVNFGI